MICLFVLADCADDSSKAPKPLPPKEKDSRLTSLTHDRIQAILSNFNQEERLEIRELFQSSTPEDRDRLLGILIERLPVGDLSALGFGCSSDKRIAVISFIGQHDDASKVIDAISTRDNVDVLAVTGHGIFTYSVQATQVAAFRKSLRSAFGGLFPKNSTVIDLHDEAFLKLQEALR